MSDGHRLVQAMIKAGKTPQNEIADIVVGEVISIKPLKVKVEDRILTESFLILGALCKETHIYTPYIYKHDHRHVVPVTNTQPGGSGPHTHLINARDTDPVKPHDDDFDIMLWRGLEVGDVVLMFKIGRGQKFYIVQRQEGAIPT